VIIIVSRHPKPLNNNRLNCSLRKPQKPSPDFPLFTHANGQWAKKIKGQFHNLGKWEDPEEALDNYLHDNGYLLTGRLPPSRDGHTVEEVRPVLEVRKDDIAIGDLEESTWKDEAEANS